MQRLVISVLLVFFSFNSQAQNRKIDSLVNRLNHQKVDSNIYNLSISIAKIYSDSAYDKALIYFNKALDVAEKSSERMKVAHVYHQIGSMYQRKGEFPTALINLNNALEIHEYLNNKTGVGQLLNDIGLIYRTWGKYDKALENYFRALKLFDEIGDEVNGAMASNSIGQIYYYRSEYEKAIEYFKKYLDVNQRIKKPRAIAGAANNIASAFMELNKLDDALIYYVRAMRIYDSLNIKIGVAVIKDNIGSLFIKKKQYNDALLYNTAALRIFEEIGSKPRMCASLQSVGLAYSRLNQTDLAIKNLNRSLDIALSIKQKETQKDVYDALADVYVQTKQFDKALSYYKLFVQIKDSLLNSKSIGKIETIQADYDAQKKEKQMAEVNQKLHNQKIIGILSAGIFILFIFLTSLIIRENLYKKRTIKTALEQTRILNSIISKTTRNRLSSQSEKADFNSLFENIWQITSSKDESCSYIPFQNNSTLFLALLSKGNPSINIDIIKLSIFDFFHTLNNENSSLSIKEQYNNFISNESVWQNVFEIEKQINIDFWCFRKDNRKQQYSGMFSAFHVDNQNQILDLSGNTNVWLNVSKGDRFYFYTSDDLNDFDLNEQIQFKSTLGKTIAKTIAHSFDEQKEILSNSLELIDAGNTAGFDISIIAFKV